YLQQYVRNSPAVSSARLSTNTSANRRPHFGQVRRKVGPGGAGRNLSHMGSVYRPATPTHGILNRATASAPAAENTTLESPSKPHPESSGNRPAPHCRPPSAGDGCPAGSRGSASASRSPPAPG